MDIQPARERAVRIRTQPKHAPQTFRLMIDIQDNLPPRELVYRNDESGLDTAMAFVWKHKLDNDLTIPIWDAITKKTGGRLFGLVEMEDIVTAAPTTKPLPSSLQAESGEFVTAKPEPANESPSEALNVDETPLQSLIDDWRKTSERTRLGIPTPRQEVAAPAFDFRTRVARFRREINEAPVRKCTPSLIVSPFATPGVQPSHAHPRLATGASEVENDASERKLVHMSNTMLKTEVRVGTLETQFENLDISKTAHGQSEDIQALQKMVAKLVKENVSLRARLARLEKRDEESIALRKTVIKLIEENVDLGARLAISEGLVENRQDVVL
ncbi:hypothetical protein LTR10_008532 [Elasticomyces elasticus]|nr:hypothetical protein LTR10_008532 [Elasticomyces elasticus]KAK4967405.1 hypothetical protein LTR42_010754 [Elasticomyces elasticus]